MLDKQRKKAFSIVYSIDAILGPEEVDVAILNGLANDLEFLLNSSVGNLRLGDGSTNSSIHSHIDPIYNSFQLSKPTGSSKWDLNFDGASIEYIASAESGIDKLTISKLSFESSKRSMARRLYRLLTISEYLKNGNVPNSVEHGDTNEIVIPAFYVKEPNKESSTVPTVYTSDYQVNEQENKQCVLPNVKILYTKKGKSRAVERSTITKEISTKKERKPGFTPIYFDLNTINTITDDTKSTHETDSTFPPPTVTTKSVGGMTISLFPPADISIIQIDETFSKSRSKISKDLGKPLRRKPPSPAKTKRLKPAGSDT